MKYFFLILLEHFLIELLILLQEVYHLFIMKEEFKVFFKLKILKDFIKVVYQKFITIKYLQIFFLSSNLYLLFKLIVQPFLVSFFIFSFSQHVLLFKEIENHLRVKIRPINCHLLKQHLEKGQIIKYLLFLKNNFIFLYLRNLIFILK